MGNRLRNNFVIRQMTISFIAFFATGSVLLISASVLLAKIVDFELAASLYMKVILIFMLIFAVMGFGMLIAGIVIAIKALVKLKKIDFKVLENEIVQTAPSASLKIIRPSLSSKSEVAVPKETSTKTISRPAPPKKAVLKQIPIKISKAPTKKETQIPSDYNYDDGLQSIIDRYNTEKVKKAFKNWYNTLMITFPDISKSFLFKINGEEGLDFSEGVDEEAAVQVKMDSTVFVKMMTKQINPIKAYSSGNLEVKGEMKNMLKLRKLMF